MDHPVAGSARYPSVPYKMSETPFSAWRAAPLLGQDNEAMYCGELGLSKDELAGLKSRGVV
jgi:crotonobetainyl-CoA:carnitine CoA-transferase CaiB-like acyl-CoA transferase